jgi:hypothetical protein
MLPRDRELPCKRPTMNERKEWKDKWRYSTPDDYVMSETEVEARGLMLKYLIVNGLIKL